MNYSFLESIYADYADQSMNKLKVTVTKEEKEFSKKYLHPLFETDYYSAMMMEAMFNSALTASNEQFFKCGFKACMHLIAECFAKEN